MSMYLVALQGSRWLTLEEGASVSVGCDEEQADWSWNDDSISPLHARISEQDGTWQVEDLNSEDGTYVNKDELPSGHTHTLQSGDRISLGMREFLFTHRPPLQPLAPEKNKELLGSVGPDSSSEAIFRETIEQLSALLDHQQTRHNILEKFLDLQQRVFGAQVAVLSLENQLYLRGISDSDPHAELLLNHVRFQTEPVVFHSALASPDDGFCSMYAPILFDDLMQGYFYIWAPGGVTWTTNDFQLFHALHHLFNQLLSTHQHLIRAQEDREMLNLNLVGIAPAMQRLKIKLLRMAPRATPVFVFGDDGVGKSRIARAVHQASPRRDAPMMVLSAANFPTELFEAEIAGVNEETDDTIRKRPGKAKLADGGSLLIEEISEFPLGAQPMLLNLIQNGAVTPVGSETPESVDVRVLVTSHTSLQELVQQNKLMAPLAEALEHYALEVPSLRQRKEDLPQLFRSFLARFGEEEGLPTTVVKDEALVHLQHHRWTENIRELREIVARCFYALDPARPIVDEELIQKVLQEHQSDHGQPRTNVLAEKVFALEVRLIQEALMANNDDVAAAAESLGVSRIVLQRKMRQIGIG